MDEKDLENAWKELEKKGYHLNSIKQEIGTDIRGALYRGYRINPESLQKLEHLVGRTILKAEDNFQTDTNARVKVESAELETIYNELKTQGYSINKISKEINTQFGNALHKGYSMNQESFNKLQQLYGKEIPHTAFDSRTQENISSEKNVELNEITQETKIQEKIEQSEPIKISADKNEEYLEVKNNTPTIKHIGNISEMNVIQDLERDGKNVLIPYGDCQRYDAVFEENGKIYRVQIKTADIKNETFHAQTRTNKGEVRDYNGEVDYFGVYNRNNNKSYLIPIEEINRPSVRLTQELKEKYEIRNHLTNDNTNELKNIESLKAMNKGKTILNQLGKINENSVKYSGVYQTEKGEIKYQFHEIKINKENPMNNTKFDAPNNMEIARANVSADLMLNGYIINTPVKQNSDYDFVIQQKYSKTNPSLQQNFQKVKIINEIYKNVNSYLINKNVDYIGKYDKKNDKSYLIPPQDIKNGLNYNEKYEIDRANNVLEKMDYHDKGDAVEMKIGAKFMNEGYNVFYPNIGRPRYDLIIHKNGKFHTVQVKTGTTRNEKDSTYVRFDITTRNSKRERGNYKDVIDLFASYDQKSSKSYVIPVNELQNTDAKLKLDERENMRQMHHGTMYARDYEFKDVDNIIQNYEAKKVDNNIIDQINQKINEKPLEIRKNLENEQIIAVLRGNLKVKNIESTNLNFQNYIENFKESQVNSRIHYQDTLSVPFRDYLIDQPELKTIIEEFQKEGDKHQEVYNFIEDFYEQHKRAPNTLELYQQFLNFKAHEVRGKINIARTRYPEFYGRNKK